MDPCGQPTFSANGGQAVCELGEVYYPRGYGNFTEILGGRRGKKNRAADGIWHW